VGTGVFEGSTSGLSEDGWASCGSTETAPDVWFLFVPEEDAVLLASTCGSDYDTVLSVHSTCPGAPANTIACNDDDCGLGSVVVLPVRSGETYYIRVSGYSGASGAFHLDLSLRQQAEGERADLVVTDLADLQEVVRSGGLAALTVETTVCNLGADAMDWHSNPDPRHPFFVFNVHRLEEERLEQIGQSWVKHAFAASELDTCGRACAPSSGSRLGPGCSDVYSAGINAHQSAFGPRSEVDPLTGAFTWAGSYLDTHRSERPGPTDRRLVVPVTAIDPLLHPTARFFVELFVVAHDDADPITSCGFKEFRVSNDRGGPFDLELLGTGARPGPIASALGGAMVVIVPPDPVGEGRVFLAARATEEAGGVWRYDYALHNLDFRRAVGSFRVPLPRGVEVLGHGFHAVESRGEGSTNAPWRLESDSDGVVWSTEPFAEGAASNPLSWGCLYSFSLAARAGPGEIDAVVGAFRPGDHAAYAARTLGPAQAVAPAVAFRRGDADGSGRVEITDAVRTLGFVFLGRTPPACAAAADADRSGVLDVSDAVFTLAWLFLGGDPPPPPGPFACGEDTARPGEPPPLPCATPPGGCR
jgi:hypothetical protein